MSITCLIISCSSSALNGFVIYATAPSAMPLFLLILNPHHPYSLAALIVMILAGPPIRAVLFDEIGPALNEALASTGKILLAYSLFFALGWIV